MKELKIGVFTFQVQKITAGDVADAMDHSGAVDEKGNIRLKVGEHWLRLLSHYVKSWEEVDGHKTIASYELVRELDPFVVSFLIADMRKECLSGDPNFLKQVSSSGAPINS